MTAIDAADEHVASDTVRTFCRVCEPACGLVAEVDGGVLVSLRPDREHPVTQGYACHKGLAMADVHADPDRLAAPLRRRPAGPAEPPQGAHPLAAVGSRPPPGHDAP